MDIENAKRAEEILSKLKQCDRLLEMWNDETTFCGQRFTLTYISPGIHDYMNISIPEELNDKIVDMIVEYKKELENELDKL